MTPYDRTILEELLGDIAPSEAAVRMVWEPSPVGCYLHSGAFTIGTYISGTDYATRYQFPNSGYYLMRGHEELGRYATLEEAQAAAEAANQAPDESEIERARRDRRTK